MASRYPSLLTSVDEKRVYWRAIGRTGEMLIGFKHRSDAARSWPTVISDLEAVLMQELASMFNVPSYLALRQIKIARSDKLQGWVVFHVNATDPGNGGGRFTFRFSKCLEQNLGIRVHEIRS